MSIAKLSTAAHHQPIGGKATHSSSPAVTAASSRIVRGGKAVLNHVSSRLTMKHDTSMHGLAALRQRIADFQPRQSRYAGPRVGGPALNGVGGGSTSISPVSHTAYDAGHPDTSVPMIPSCTPPARQAPLGRGGEGRPRRNRAARV